VPTDFSGAFTELRSILKKHSVGLKVIKDTQLDFTVTSPGVAPNKKPLWFGCVLQKKSAVTFHFMPLYFNPKLIGQVPAELLKRMQGKTCFNFQRPDPVLFGMLDVVVGLGREQWERAGLLADGPISGERIMLAAKAGGTNIDALAKKRKAKGRSSAAKRAQARPN